MRERLRRLGLPEPPGQPNRSDQMKMNASSTVSLCCWQASSACDASTHRHAAVPCQHHDGPRMTGPSDRDNGAWISTGFSLLLIHFFSSAYHPPRISVVRLGKTRVGKTHIRLLERDCLPYSFRDQNAMLSTALSIVLLLATAAVHPATALPRIESRCSACKTIAKELRVNFALTLAMITSRPDRSSDVSMHQITPMRMGSHSWDPMHLQIRMQNERPRNHLDMRHRLDSQGQRYGKVIDYK